MEPLELHIGGPGAGSRRLVPGQSLLLGRAPGNDLVLQSVRVSSHHAAIEPRGDAWVVRDLGSRNGTFVNGVRVAEVALAEGDVLHVGDVRIHVARCDDPVAVSGGAVVGEASGSRVRGSIERDELSGFKPAARIEDLEELRGDYEKLRLAHGLAMRLGAEWDVDRLLARLLGFCLQVLPADNAVALMLPPGEGQLCPRAFRHRSPTGEQVLVSRSVVEQVQRTGDALLVEDTGADEDLRSAASIVGGRIRSVLAVPILIRDEVIGALVLDSRSQERAFEGRDLHLLAGIAAQAALALERADLLATREREIEAQRLLIRFLSPALIEDIQRGRLELSRAPESRPVVVLFADMRGSTGLAERLGPGPMVSLLNQLFSCLEEEIFQHGGVLDKFVGDAVMALWGYPTSGPDDDTRAVRCALAMQRQIAALSEDRVARGLEPVAAGIAVHRGDAVVGCIGSHRRMDFTAIGDTVNLAARLSGHAGPGEVLVSQSVGERLVGEFQIQEMPELRVKGRHAAVRALRIG
jgi:adenylate cyclase